MVQPSWISENRKIMICVDDYDEGVLRGRFYHAVQGMSSFGSLSQFLLKMEAALEQAQEPQSYTAKRSFSSLLPWDDHVPQPSRFRRGEKATFELTVLFRQHSSWQGVLTWTEQRTAQSFRSVLELVCLLDSALQQTQGRKLIP